MANFSANLYVSPFSVSFDLLGSNYTSNISTQLVLKVAFTNNTDPNDPSGFLYGLRTERLCYLAPATVRYPIKLTGTTVEINEDGFSTQGSPSIVDSDRLQTHSFSPVAEDGSDAAGSDYERWTLGKNFPNSELLEIFPGSCRVLGAILLMPQFDASSLRSILKRNNVNIQIW